MNKIIIDGYNFIHAVPVLASLLDNSLESARDELVRLLKAYCYRRTVQIFVVFDGTFPPLGIDPPHPSGRVQIRFSRSPFKADPMIKNMIQKERARKTLTVVTNDRDILQYAGANHAQTSRCEDFFTIIRKKVEIEPKNNKKNESELTDDELAEWLKLFGESG